MRFNKFTHLSLLVVFAIIFIVIYLYYTISDVKKIHQEVSKLTRDMEFLNGSLQQMTTALLTNTIPISTPSAPPANIETEPPVAALAPEQVQESNDDEDEEVASQEIQQIMESIEDDEDQELNSTSLTPNVDINSIDAVDVTETVTSKQSVTLENFTMEELKKVSYDDIKKYCKEHSINTKGTKDVLIYRIAQSKAA